MSNWTEREISSATRIERAALDLVSEVNALADMTCDTLSDSIAMIDQTLNPDEYSRPLERIDPLELLTQLREDLSALLRRYDSAAIGANPRE
jgi:hypothetical protein